MQEYAESVSMTVLCNVFLQRFPADGPGDGKTGGHEEENGQGQRGASKESMVQWYFSPVIPLASRRGYPSTTQGDVLHLELRMRQSSKSTKSRIITYAMNLL